MILPYMILSPCIFKMRIAAFYALTLSGPEAAHARLQTDFC